ncbi:MAG: hypothetical protein WDM87_04730 [Terracidiphilus sp.]
MEKTITQTHMHTKVNIEKQVQGADDSTGEPGECARCFRRCVGWRRRATAL